MANSEPLGLRDVNTLLPDNLKIDTEKSIERSVCRTVEGKPLPIVNSKLYPAKYYWYSCITKYFKEIGTEYICFTVGLNGILVIPIDIVLHYNKFSGWKGKYKKGRQYHVRIKCNEDETLNFWNFNDPNENIEVTQYLYK
ncbi:MAG: hypothetical protein E7085_03695 [Parabacteroides distasonis]|nr:hypothetical protein [Parabacteroides distasonis]